MSVEAIYSAARVGAAPLVRIDGLTVRFAGADSPAVDNITLTIAAGECLALVGESGSGKSVTARSLVGLAGAGAQVSADTLEVNGLSLLGLSERRLERMRGAVVGSISQDALVSLDPLRLIGREVDDALRLHTRLSPTDRRARVLQLLTQSGIPDPETRVGQRSGELSGGLRQRVLIAAALAAGPRILIADEPTTALDSQVRDGVLRLIADQATAGTAVLLISHDLTAVAAIADRVAVMKDGRIVEEGDTSAVLHNPQHPYTRQLLAASPANKPRHQLLLSGPTARESLPSTRTGDRTASAPEPRPALALEATDLSVAFSSGRDRSRPVLQNVSFALPVGTTLGLVGPSGSGKTTLARIALGLQQPDSGELRLLGKPWSSTPEKLRRADRALIGAIYQDPLGSFDPRSTVRAILADAVQRDGASPSRAGRTTRVTELLDSVGLASNIAERRPHSLSGGQRQRVAIARALAAEPRVLILDEPVSALDVTIQAQILDLLDALQRDRGLSYLFISHDTDVIAHMSDSVLRLD
ncbi:peptide/nickel transport system ATP-binding protein [Glaciihabitans tibetensis]|uniref:Peptide/nickel transport system ATP-binding protein n=1 Tax=Glaciihabitans tibetensis TaxID=1266600 RepID=A0A2T0VIQ2_9MICO|nr:ABC transporter ATP-binding protein [Glaciihabitans tibetensis]PRY70116.1 peptide/nickel transport system ATP-binding protein [Glaciihabitans tibetensis]